MESEDPRFKHIGISSDGTVIFCEMDNGKAYAMPINALASADDWNPKAKPMRVKIIHDGYAAIVEFNSKMKIDFPTDFVLYHCELSYAWHKSKIGRFRKKRVANAGPRRALQR
jgi:hypothetical protein